MKETRNFEFRTSHHGRVSLLLKQLVANPKGQAQALCNVRIYLRKKVRVDISAVNPGVLKIAQAIQWKLVKLVNRTGSDLFTKVSVVVGSQAVIKTEPRKRFVRSEDIPNDTINIISISLILCGIQRVVGKSDIALITILIFVVTHILRSRIVHHLLHEHVMRNAVSSG